MTIRLDLPSFSILSNAARHCGCDLQAVQTALDLQISADAGPFSELALADIIQLLMALEAAANNGHFPFVCADSFHFADRPAISAFLMSSQSLRDAGPLLDWIPKLIHPGIQLSPIDRGSEALIDIQLTHAPEPAASSLVELIAAVVAHMMATIAPSINAISAVKFSHPARASKPVYEQYFNCPVTFNAPHNRLLINPSALDQSLPGSLPTVHAQAEATIRTELVGDGFSPPLPMLVDQQLKQQWALLGQGIAAMAATLKMHPRTLQRQLKDSGTSYSAVLDKVRHELAQEMLREGVLDIDSIGFKLGFAERRSFSAAFHKWQGQTPSAYRKQFS